MLLQRRGEVAEPHLLDEWWWASGGVLPEREASKGRIQTHCGVATRQAAVQLPGGGAAGAVRLPQDAYALLGAYST